MCARSASTLALSPPRDAWAAATWHIAASVTKSRSATFAVVIFGGLTIVEIGVWKCILSSELKDTVNLMFLQRPCSQDSVARLPIMQCIIGKPKTVRLEILLV